MNVAQPKSWVASLFAILLLVSVGRSQSEVQQTAHAAAPQSNVSLLTTLPEADTIIYLSPQKILTEAAPKMMAADDLLKLRADFADIKKNVGIDPSTVDSLVLAVRFHKPSGDLSFVAPDVLSVVSGDFSAEALVTLAGSLLKENSRTEQYNAKTITIVKIDALEEEARDNPMLRSFAELGVVALNGNTFAIGTVNYLKAAIDAAAGNGRINPATVNSVLRNPNALVSAAGSPLSAFAKSFGLLGTETTPRESRCDSHFGDFYAAITIDATNVNFRGAMNADNPDTAKIINGMISGVVQPLIGALPEEAARTVLQAIRMQARESEVVWEADVPHQTVAAFIQEQMKSKEEPAVKATPAPAKPKTAPKRRVRRKTAK